MHHFFRNLLNPRNEALGVEIGSTNLKLVELAPNPLRVTGVALRPTPAGVVRDGVVIDPPAVGGLLREMVAEIGTRRRLAVTAASNLGVITRNLQVPKMPDKQMDEAVRWEAERYIPYPLEEVVLDYAPLGDTRKLADGTPIEVMVGAARQELVGSLVEALRLGGLEPLAIDIKPLACLRTIYPRLLIAPNHDQEPVTLFMEIGAESTALVLTRGARPLLTRFINLSGHDFTLAISRAFNLEEEQAEEAKKNYGLATIPTEDDDLLLDFDAERERFSPARMYDAIRPVLVEMTTEMRRSLDFFRVQAGDISIDQAFVLGGASKMRGLVGLLSTTLGMNLEVVDPWMTIRVEASPHLPDPELLRSLGPELAVAIGLAMRGVEGT